MEETITKTNNTNLLDLSYMLQLRIGVFYKTEEWKKLIYDSILSNVSEDAIEGKFKTWIKLKTNTIIYFLRANDNSRGYKLHRVIVEPIVDEEIYDMIIRHSLITEQNSSIVAFDNGKSHTADDYYFNLKYLKWTEKND